MDESDRQINFNSLKKSTISLPVAIPIMDEFDHQINFNRLKKSATSLSAAIGALGSPLGPHIESDIVTDLYTTSTRIANIDMSGYQTSFNNFNKSVISLLAAIGALGSPLGPHLKSDLVTDLYSTSTRIANIDMSGYQISFNSLNKSVISLLAAIGALSSPLGPHLESNLETDLYSGSTLIAIKMSPIIGSVSDDFKKSTTSI
jgi:NRPS condensation-like uncharacterized protein